MDFIIGALIFMLGTATGGALFKQGYLYGKVRDEE